VDAFEETADQGFQEIHQPERQDPELKSTREPVKAKHYQASGADATACAPGLRLSLLLFPGVSSLKKEQKANGKGQAIPGYTSFPGLSASHTFTASMFFRSSCSL
jgi:hypothetical protein